MPRAPNQNRRINRSIVVRFEKLAPKRHDRKRFDCGVEALNRYVREIANQDTKRNLTRVYVLAESSRIIGYCSISAHMVSCANMPSSHAFGGYDGLPFLLLGRLAVDKEYQKRGYGDALIAHAFAITRDVAERVGVIGMVVDAKDENAASYYEKFGFHRLTSTKQRLMLPLSAMKGLV